MKNFDIGDLVEVVEAFFIGKEMRAFDLDSGKIKKGTRGMVLSIAKDPRYRSELNYVNILCSYGMVKNVRTDWLKKI